ncbi:MAG: PIG-L family deacetylase [Chloroflexi bacterium]|nr:PIG-L family deacetylase [Chloroflexota bacterium]
MPKNASRSTRTANHRVILGVFAHPDDETTSSAGTMCRYSKEGVPVHIISATRGEQGALGTNGVTYTRKELPAVRERELREALARYGANPPVFLGYRDQEMKDANPRELVGKIEAEMLRVRPTAVITFGPHGISKHPDHTAVHKATKKAFDSYRKKTGADVSLLYVALPGKRVKEFKLDLDGPETKPNVTIDITPDFRTKIWGLRNYRSQEDAQFLAKMFEERKVTQESFHQIYPPLPKGTMKTRLWE